MLLQELITLAADANLNLELLIRQIKDNLHKGGYYLEKYIINDGRKHPVAIICHGGAYTDLWQALLRVCPARAE